MGRYRRGRIGDNADPDADGDGVANATDLFPFDAAKSDIASYVFLSEIPGDRAGAAMLAVGGGNPGFLIGAPGLPSWIRARRIAHRALCTSLRIGT